MVLTGFCHHFVDHATAAVEPPVVRASKFKVCSVFDGLSLGTVRESGHGRTNGRRDDLITLGKCCWKIVTASTASAMGGQLIIRTTGKPSSRLHCVGSLSMVVWGSQRRLPCTMSSACSSAQLPMYDPPLCSPATCAETDLEDVREYSHRMAA